jgi:DNA-directed RNA polymerase subunit F
MLLASRIVAATALVALSASACNDRALNVDGAATDGGHRGSASISPEQASKVLAHVGDRTITLGDYVASLQHMDQFDRLRYQSPERRRELLKDMINIQILADEAVAKGYDKDPLAQQEVRSILRNAMMEQARAGAPTSNAIPEAEVHAYFDAHRDQFKDPERRRISVIVVADDKSARDVLESATKTPTSIHWGELVRTKSVDAAAKANVPVDLAGDFGMVTPPGVTTGENGRVPEEVREASFRIPEIGGVYDKPVKSKTVDPREARPGQGPRARRRPPHPIASGVPGADRRRRTRYSERRPRRRRFPPRRGASAGRGQAPLRRAWRRSR